MPPAREEHHDGAREPLDVAVERLEEPIPRRVVDRDERVDEHDRLCGLPVDAAHLAVPVRTG